ncbi:hypothetical protein Tco_1325432, partial [Tanacetum coccineum]
MVKIMVLKPLTEETQERRAEDKDVIELSIAYLPLFRAKGLFVSLASLSPYCPRSNLECKSANKRQRQEESIINAIRSWGVPGGSLQLAKETLAEFAYP